MYFGERRLVGPGQGALLAALVEVFHQILPGQGLSALVFIGAADMEGCLQQGAHLAVLLLFQAFLQDGGVFPAVPSGQDADGDLTLRCLFGGQESQHIRLPVIAPIEDFQKFFSDGFGAVLGEAQDFLSVLLRMLSQDRKTQASSCAGGLPETGYGLFPPVCQVSLEDLSGGVLQLVLPSVHVEGVIGVRIAVELSAQAQARPVHRGEEALHPVAADFIATLSVPAPQAVCVDISSVQHQEGLAAVAQRVIAVGVLIGLEDVPVAAAPAVAGAALQPVLIGVERGNPAAVLQVIPHRGGCLGVHNLHQGVDEPGLLPGLVRSLPLLVQIRIHLLHDVVHPVEGIEIRRFHALQENLPVALELAFQDFGLSLGGGPGDELLFVHGECLVECAAPFIQIPPQVYIVHDVQHVGRVRRKTYLQHVSQHGGLGVVDEGRAAQDAQDEPVHRQVRPGLFQYPVVYFITVDRICDLVHLQLRHLVPVEAVQAVGQDFPVLPQKGHVPGIDLHRFLLLASPAAQEPVHTGQEPALPVGSLPFRQPYIGVLHPEIGHQEDDLAVLRFAFLIRYGFADGVRLVGCQLYQVLDGVAVDHVLIVANLGRIDCRLHGSLRQEDAVLVVIVVSVPGHHLAAGGLACGEQDMGQALRLLVPPLVDQVDAHGPQLRRNFHRRGGEVAKRQLLQRLLPRRPGEVVLRQGDFIRREQVGLLQQFHYFSGSLILWVDHWFGSSFSCACERIPLSVCCCLLRKRSLVMHLCRQMVSGGINVLMLFPVIILSSGIFVFLFH